MQIERNPELYRILAIDNGSSAMGVVIADLDLVSHKMYIQEAHTCNAKRILSNNMSYQGTVDVDGERIARYLIMRDFLDKQLRTYNPDAVSVESPFMFKQPQAFAVLREMMLMIRLTVRGYDLAIPLFEVTPLEAKTAVGTRVKKRKERVDNKVLVRDAVLALDYVEYENDIEPTELDEHCIDGVAVACYIRNSLLDTLKTT